MTLRILVYANTLLATYVILELFNACLIGTSLVFSLNVRKSLRGKGLESTIEAASSPSPRGAVSSVVFHTPFQVQISAVTGGSTNVASHSNSEYSNQSSFAVSSV